MSGGSYNYAFATVEDAANAIEGRSMAPLRRAFAAHLRLVAMDGTVFSVVAEVRAPWGGPVVWRAK